MINDYGNRKIRPNIETFLKIVFLCLFFFSLSGCGREAFPTAPLSMVPEPPKKMEAVIENGDIKLSWVLANQDNVKLIHIYRSKIPIIRFCSTCPYTFEPVRSVQPSEKIYREKAAPGYHYAFKIEIEGLGREMSSPKIVTLEIP